MHELAVSFGPAKHLAGTLAMPDELASGGVGFIMLNAGVVHRMGPHRFNVRLARQLAEQGWPSLRFDLAGQGDSDNSPQSQPFERQIIADLRAAMDHLGRTTGVDRFVVAGICSGAHRGLAVADEDERVVGLWMLDGHAYPGPRTAVQRRLLQWRHDPAGSLRNWLRWPWRWIVRRAAALHPARTDGAPAEIDYGRNTPTREAYAAILRKVDGRNGRVFVMHSGGMLASFSYAGQFRDVFGQEPFAQRVRCEFWPDIDHTLSTRAAQERVIAAVTGWAGEAFGDQGKASKQKPE